MNKKILMSVAAAATIATTFTGCGSDSNSATSSISGTAVKANLNGATVTLGSQTATTSTDGSFSLSVPSTESETVISISGGSYTLGNIETNNTMTLKATKAQLSDNIPASVMTTLVQEFDGNITKAANVLGVNYVEGQDLADIAKNPGVFEKAAASIEMVYKKMNSDTERAALFTALENNSTSQITIAQLSGALQAASATAGVTLDANATNALAAMKDGLYGVALDVINGNADASTGIGAIQNDAKYTKSDVINLNQLRYQLGTGSPQFFSNSNKSDNQRVTLAATSTMDDNTTNVLFKLENNATLEHANANTSLFVTISGLDAANANNSYMMGLTGLDVEAISSTDFFFINTNSSMALSTISNSNTSYAVSVDSNASALTSMFSQDTNTNMTKLNVSMFKNYMDSLYVDQNTSTVGNFTEGMADGNFSLKVFVNVNDQEMTENQKRTDLIKGTMTQTENETGSKVFNNLGAYMILDTNLTY